MEKERNFEWDGDENISEIFQYSHSLGPQGTEDIKKHEILQLTYEETLSIRNLYIKTCPSVLVPDLTESQKTDLLVSEKALQIKFDDFLSKIKGKYKEEYWFLKTNRHSCKDSPLDNPNQNDLQLFINEISKIEIPSLEIPVENLDFGIFFKAMLRSRLKSLMVRNGTDIINLLARSKTIYNDINLQMGFEIPWSFYLALSPFDKSIPEYSQNEFRCYVNGRKLRCVMQYYYFLKIDLEQNMLEKMVQCMAKKINDDILPKLPKSIVDFAIDIQCIPKFVNNNKSGFDVKLIETNPLGPGTVWGLLEWENDAEWLLGKKPIPPYKNITSASLGEINALFVKISNEEGEKLVDNMEGNEVILLFCNKHRKGLDFYGFNLFPPDFMLEIWKHWRIEERKQVETCQKRIKKKECLLI